MEDEYIKLVNIHQQCRLLGVCSCPAPTWASVHAVPALAGSRRVLPPHSDTSRFAVLWLAARPGRCRSRDLSIKLHKLTRSLHKSTYVMLPPCVSSIITLLQYTSTCTKYTKPRKVFWMAFDVGILLTLQMMRSAVEMQVVRFGLQLKKYQTINVIACRTDFFKRSSLFSYA